MKNLLSLILFFLACEQMDAQNNAYSIHILPSRDFIATGNVHDLYMDKDGYMWYSTEENLCRDNGYQLDVFCSDDLHPDLIGSNFVLDISEDNDGHIWFGTSKGVYILNKRDFNIHAVCPEETKGLRCEALISLSDGTTWMCTGQQILHFNSKEQLLDNIPTNHNPLKGNYAESLYEDSSGNLWLLESGGDVCRFDSGKKRFIRYDCELISPRRIIEDPVHGCYWVGTWGHGVYKFMPDLQSNSANALQQASSLGTDSSGRSKSEVIDLILDSKEPIVWVTSMDGLHAYTCNSGSLNEQNLAGLMPEGKNIVDRMEYDNHGNIWVSAFSPHTFILTSSNSFMRRNQMLSVLPMMGNSVIGDFVISDSEGLWLWDPRNGLILENCETGRITLGCSFPEDSSMHGSGVITPIRGENKFWMSSDNNIVKLWHEGDVIRRELFTTLPNILFFGLFDPGDGFLWAATTKGVKKIDKQYPGTIVQVTDSSDVVYRIAADKEGNYFCHTAKKGLYTFISKSHTTKQLLRDVETCTCMTLDATNTLWFGTDLGRVYRYRAGDECAEQIDGLGNVYGNRILDIKSDGNGHVWSVSSHILKEWNPETNISRTLLASDPSIQMDYMRTLGQCGDSICVAGAMGYCMIPSSSQLRKNHSDAIPLVSSVTIDGEKQCFGKSVVNIDISHTADLVEISLTTLEYLYASQIQFAYRLCKKSMLGGTDDSAKWTELPLGENVIRFASLPKGDYVLELKSTDPYGVWGEPSDALLINRLPAWWESWWAYLAYIAVFVSLGVWIVRRYLATMRRKRMDQMEEQLTELKFKFFTNISHELRTPLTLIMLPLESMMKKSDSFSDADKKRLESMHSNASELLEMINQLLDFRRMELGESSLNCRNGNIIDFINTAVETFQSMALRKDIRLTFNHQENSIYLNFDHEKMHHIVWNLLSNALKFTPDGGKVDVSIERESDGKLKIHVIDNGTGISPEHLPHIFERYYQSSDTHAEGGAGIGLHLVSELVRMHGGEVNVESVEGKGAHFWFTLPMNLPGSGSPDLSSDAESLSDAESFEHPSTSGNVILLVEDNLEFRSLMHDTLQEEGYVILQAGNGEEAWNLIKDHDVNLVISDVMMPVMNGFELCKKIKTDFDVSHIPVILLTAKTGDENQLEGYKMGADYYMTKPFSMDLLLNRITHLGMQKAQLQSSFQHDPENDIVGITHSKLDEEFLQKAIEVVENNISDAKFNVETFSQEMFSSRMTLYRKVSSITGLSPSEFITTIRLKKAAEMLRETSSSVGMISEQCGFSSASYFTKNFKKMFGVLPKEYRLKSN